jgi:hypothetical protein
VRRATIERGDSERWRAMARGVVDGEFCRTVEEDRLDERVETWR